MKRIQTNWRACGLAAAGLLLIGSALPTVAAAQAKAAPSAQAAGRTTSAASPAKAPNPTLSLMQTACANCHELAIVTNQRKSRDEWNTTINNMITHGAPITDQQADEILDYLSKNYSYK